MADLPALSGRLLGAMKMQMNHANQRQAVLSKNIANADTPGYKALDLEPLNFKNEMRGDLQMMVTSPQHLPGNRKKPGFKVEKDRNTPDVTPNGNNVLLDEQTLKMSMNSSDYQTVTSLYKTVMAMIKSSGDSR